MSLLQKALSSDPPTKRCLNVACAEKTFTVSVEGWWIKDGGDEEEEEGEEQKEEEKEEEEEEEEEKKEGEGKMITRVVGALYTWEFKEKRKVPRWCLQKLFCETWGI